MKERAWQDIYDAYNDRIDALERAHKEAIAAAENERVLAMIALEERCLAEHGSHLDNGAMFYGACARCGVHFG